MIGTIVHYWPGELEALSRNEGQPLAALIVSVNLEGLANLSVFDSHGFLHVRHTIQVVAAEAEKVDGAAQYIQASE